MVRADFTREKEELWFPILESIGFSSPSLTSHWDDEQNASDIIASNKRFGVRARSGSSYNEEQLSRYAKEFTIRYSRPTGVPTEYHKLFEVSRDCPDYLAYGWRLTVPRLDYWVIVEVQTLIQVQVDGHLDQFETEIRQNTDWRRSRFLPILIPQLRQAIEPGTFQKLFPFYSENHPAFS